MTSEATLSFDYENVRFEGTDIDKGYQILLDVVGDFSVNIDSRVLFEEVSFPVVELAVALNDWLHMGFRERKAFIHETMESEELGLVRIRPAHDGQWQVASVRQRYLETQRFDADVIETVCKAFIQRVASDLKVIFGIEGFPMTSRYVGNPVYTGKPCPLCGSGIAFWLCADGHTIVLRCEKCGGYWTQPDRIWLDTMNSPGANGGAIPSSNTRLFLVGTSRWATEEKISAKGWGEWISTDPAFSYDKLDATTDLTPVRINAMDPDLVKIRTIQVRESRYPRRRAGCR